MFSMGVKRGLSNLREGHKLQVFGKSARGNMWTQ
jgi:hypothetical protein